jgi:hypothetical protein
MTCIPISNICTAHEQHLATHENTAEAHRSQVKKGIVCNTLLYVTCRWLYTDLASL